MKTIDIKSVLNSNRAYRLSDDWPWNARGNAPLSLYIQWYDTYGDGMCQHSPCVVAQFHDLADVCLSITKAVCEDPRNEAWRILNYIWSVFISEDGIKFALSIRYREDKDQWFCFADRKVSTSESKRHDRRWEKVESWMDGKPATALSIALNAAPSLDWIGKLEVADKIRHEAGFPMWSDLFKPASELTGDWQQAFQAFRAVCEMLQKLDYASGACEASIGNFTRHAQTNEPVMAIA